MEPTPRQVAVKVSPEGDRLITSGVHYLRMDGSRAARVAMLAGMTREELEAVGGVQEDD
jgi:hypothetical protein